MTNFERIKAMDREEMADFLDDFQLGEFDVTKTFCDWCPDEKCDGCIPWWLDNDSKAPQGIDYWVVKLQEG